MKASIVQSEITHELDRSSKALVPILRVAKGEIHCLGVDTNTVEYKLVQPVRCFYAGPSVHLPDGNMSSMQQVNLKANLEMNCAHSCIR